MRSISNHMEVVIKMKKEIIMGITISLSSLLIGCNCDEKKPTHIPLPYHEFLDNQCNQGYVKNTITGPNPILAKCDLECEYQKDSDSCLCCLDILCLPDSDCVYTDEWCSEDYKR